MNIKGEYTQTWFLQNIPVWEEILKNIKGQPLSALEIGSYEGMSSVWMMENILTHPNSTLTCIDNFAGKGEFDEHPTDWNKIKERFIKNTLPYKDKLSLKVEDSYNYLRYTDSRFDLIYVDGSHRAKDCLTDAVLSHYRLNSNGIIIFDDYLWKSIEASYDVPKGAIDAFMSCFSRDYHPLSLGYQVILRKK